MKLLRIFIVIFFACSCFKQETTDAFGNPVCPTGNDYSGNSSTLTIGSSEKIAQKFPLNGTVGKILHTSKITVNMDSSNLTQIKLDLYMNQSGGGLINPESGIFVGSTTVTSGLGSSDPNTEIEFNFSTPLQIQVPNNYWIVLTPTGGSFQIPVISPQKMSTSTVMRYSGSWSTASGTNDSNLSVKFTYSHCTD